MPIGIRRGSILDGFVNGYNEVWDTGCYNLRSLSGHLTLHLHLKL